MVATRNAASSRPAATGFHELHGQQLFGTLLGLMLGILLGALDQTIVGTAMPRVIADLNGFDRYAWVVTAYLLTSTIAVPIFGKLSDQFGRKWLYIGGIIIFLLGSALCGASGDWGSLPLIGDGMNQLIFFRGLQGLGAGIMAANAFAIIGDIFPPAERGKWQGIISSLWGLASVVGPTLGGWITDNWTWRWVFYVNLPVGALALGVLISEFPYFRPEGRRPKIDYWGVSTLVVALIPLLLALEWGGNEYAWSSVQIIGMLLFSACMLVAFAVVEHYAAEPIIPLDLFKNRIFDIATISVFLSGFAMFGTIVFIPLFIQGVIGVSATASGVVLTPLSLALMVGSILSGQIIARTGKYKYIALAGAAIMAVGVFLLHTMDTTTTQEQATFYMIVTGFGLGTGFPIFTIVVQNAFPYQRLGVVTSATQFFRQIGATVGTAILGSFLTSRVHDSIVKNLPAPMQRIPSAQLENLLNPQVLVSPQTQAQLQQFFAGFGPAGQQIYQQFMATVKDALATGTQTIFTIAFIVVIISGCALFFLPEIPLRKSNRGPQTMPGQSAVAAPNPLRSRALLGVLLAFIAREAEQPNVDPSLLASLATAADGQYPSDMSTEERGRAVAQDILMPIALELMTPYIRNQAATISVPEPNVADPASQR